MTRTMPSLLTGPTTMMLLFGLTACGSTRPAQQGAASAAPQEAAPEFEPQPLVVEVEAVSGDSIQLKVVRPEECLAPAGDAPCDDRVVPVEGAAVKHPDGQVLAETGPDGRAELNVAPFVTGLSDAIAADPSAFDEVRLSVTDGDEMLDGYLSIQTPVDEAGAIASAVVRGSRGAQPAELALTAFPAVAVRQLDLKKAQAEDACLLGTDGGMLEATTVETCLKHLVDFVKFAQATEGPTWKGGRPADKLGAFCEEFTDYKSFGYGAQAACFAGLAGVRSAAGLDHAEARTAHDRWRAKAHKAGELPASLAKMETLEPREVLMAVSKVAELERKAGWLGRRIEEASATTDFDKLNQDAEALAQQAEELGPPNAKWIRQRTQGLVKSARGAKAAVAAKQKEETEKFLRSLGELRPFVVTGAGLLCLRGKAMKEMTRAEGVNDYTAYETWMAEFNRAGEQAGNMFVRAQGRCRQMRDVQCGDLDKAMVRVAKAQCPDVADLIAWGQ